jgi:hypothetical protein
VLWSRNTEARHAHRSRYGCRVERMIKEYHVDEARCVTGKDSDRIRGKSAGHSTR